MRPLLLLFLFPLVFAQPLISESMEDNNLVAQDLDDFYNSSIAESSILTVTFENSTEKDIINSASMEIAGMNLLLDNMTYPADGLSLVVALGYEQGHLIAKPSEGYLDFICDYDWYQGGAQYAWRCDFDDDYCLEFEYQTSVAYELNVTFGFRNVSESVLTSSNLVEVPQPVLDAMKNSSGYDYLNVSVEGDVIFSYEFNDQQYVGMDCADSYFNESDTISFSLNRSFFVAGQQKLFFLRSPVLGEQWFRNNRFDVVVLSQSPLYQATTSFNGNPVDNRTLRTFNITTDHYGLEQIISNKTTETGWAEYRSLTNPLPLQMHNNSFSFIYEFNHSYQGIGKNDLGLSVVDSFLGEAEYKATLLSRMLSYDETKTETGDAMDPEITRKSSRFGKEELSRLEVSLGFLALIVLLAFLNFWIKR